MSSRILTQKRIDDLTSNAPSWSELIDTSEVVCTTGMKRHGKSTLTYDLLEELGQEYDKPMYAWGVPLAKRELFPEHIHHIDDLYEIQYLTNACISLDEIHRSFNARGALKKDNIEFSEILTFSGQNNQILFLTTLNNGLIDINTFRIANPILAYKRVGNLQAGAERYGVRKYTEQAKDAWSRIPRGRKDTPERDMECQLTYIISEEYVGWMKNPKPSWWSKDISEIHSKKLQSYISTNRGELKMKAMAYESEWLEFCVKKANRSNGSFAKLNKIKKEYPIEKFYVEHILKDEWETENGS